MRRNPERLAWIILLLSFAACVFIAISVPLTIRWWIDTSYVGLQVAASVQQGTLQVTCSNSSVPIAITERMEDVCPGVEGSAVLTLSGDQAMLILRTRDAAARAVAEIHLSNDTQVQLVQARAPRFPISSQPYTVIVRLESGRVRLSVPAGLTRRVVLQAHTPTALVQTSAGSVSVQVRQDETQVRAYDGSALVVWKARGEGINLAHLESVVVPPPAGELRAWPPAQDLIVNGDFSAPLADGQGWQIYSKDIEVEGQSGGEIALTALDHTTLLGFTRIGVGHAETGIRQVIDCDVQDVQSLHLRLKLRVLEQDVPVCGTRGTECPLMVKIDYQDAAGELRSWLQGFYSMLDPARVNPPFCTICYPRADHFRVEQGAWYVYDSPNLIPLLSQAGPPPARILAVTLYASGHTYQAQVARIELLAQK